MFMSLILSSIDFNNIDLEGGNGSVKTVPNFKALAYVYTYVSGTNLSILKSFVIYLPFIFLHHLGDDRAGIRPEFSDKIEQKAKHTYRHNHFKHNQNF